MPAFTDSFGGWKLRNQLHCVILMSKHENFSRGLNEMLRRGLSMSSWEITLHLALRRSALHILTIHVYILDVANAFLVFHPLTTLRLSVWTLSLLSDNSDNRLITDLQPSDHFLCAPISSHVCSLNTSPSYHVARYPWWYLRQKSFDWSETGRTVWKSVQSLPDQHLGNVT
jgi:hypothetical protein